MSAYDRFLLEEGMRDLPGWARVAVAVAVGVLLACSALAI